MFFKSFKTITFFFTLQALAVTSQTIAPAEKIEKIPPTKSEDEKLGMSDDMVITSPSVPDVSGFQKEMMKSDFDKIQSEIMRQFNDFPNPPFMSIPFSSFDFDTFGKTPQEPKDLKKGINKKSSAEKATDDDVIANVRASSIEDPFELWRFVNKMEKSLRPKSPIEKFFDDQNAFFKPGGKGDPIAEITVITLGDDNDNGKQEMIPFGSNLGIKTTNYLPRRNEAPEIESSMVRNVLNDFVKKMSTFIDFLQKSSEVEESYTDNTIRLPEEVNIRIEDRDRVYNIPPTAYVDRSIPGIVNITWRSQLENENNSLCLRILKDDSGHIFFQHLHLRILKDDVIQEYDLDEPLYLKRTGPDGAVIGLNGGVRINFPSSASLNNVIAGRKETYSTHWLIFSVALLGLVVAGLIMLLSYIMHARNQFYARKDSITKVPIA